MSYDAYPWPPTLTKGALLRGERVKQIVLALQCDDLNSLQIQELLNITPSVRRKSMQTLLDCGLVTVPERIAAWGKGMAVFRLSSDETRVAHYLHSLGNPLQVRPTNIRGKRGRSGVRSVDQPLNPGWKFSIPAPHELLALFYSREFGRVAA